MAYCPHCKDYFDETNESEGCSCSCGYYGTDASPDDIQQEEFDETEEGHYTYSVQELKLSFKEMLENYFKLEFEDYLSENSTIDYFEDEINHDPSDYTLHFRKSILYFKLEDFSLAILSCITAKDILKKKIKLVEGRNKFFNIKCNNNTDDYKVLVKYYEFLALLYESLGSHRKAISVFKEILKLDYQHGKTYLYLGYCYVNLNKYWTALKCWELLNKYDNKMFLYECKLHSYDRLIFFLKKGKVDYNVYDKRNCKEYRTIRNGYTRWFIDNIDYEIEGNSIVEEFSSIGFSFGRYYKYEQAIKACPQYCDIPEKQDYLKVIEWLSSMDTPEIIEKNGNQIYIFDIPYYYFLKNDLPGFELFFDSLFQNLNSFPTKYWVKDLDEENRHQYFYINIPDLFQINSIFKKNNLLDVFETKVKVEMGFNSDNMVNNVLLKCCTDLDYPYEKKLDF